MGDKILSFFIDLAISLVIFFAIYSFAIAIVEHEEIKEAKRISSSTRN